MKLRYILLLAAVIFIGWNKFQYNKSFDHVEQLVKEIHRNQKIQHNKILTLQASLYGIEVNYE